MPLDPDAQRLLDLIRLAARPPFETLSAQEARAVYAAGRLPLQPEPQDVADVVEGTAPGPAGPIPLRLYRGIGAAPDGLLPALIYFHGGGWVVGDLDTHDGVCRHLANAAHCRVISVDYRLAPEHRFPAAAEDSLAVAAWVGANAESLGIDPARIAYGGDSAGGNLAAVAAIAARDGAAPSPVLQLLLYPAVDLGGHYPSYERITEGFPLTTTTMRWFLGHYVADPAHALDWRASPIRAASLAGTAPAYVMTAGYDPLSDEGLAYAKRLESEGVAVTYVHYSDQLHGFLTMGKVIRASAVALDMAAAALRRAFG